MTLNVETIQELQKKEATQAVQHEIDKSGLKANLLALPSGVKTVDLEEYQGLRNRYRFSFQTTLIKDFAVYCDEFAELGTKCFVNADGMNAKTFLDLGQKDSPLHQNHTALLTLKRTAAFKALMSINGQHLRQKEASNFIEDWADNLTVYASDDTAMSLHQAAKRLREITIEQVASRDSSVSDFGESQSAFEKVEAKNQETIPASVNFICKPYHGLGDRAFTLRVSILTGDSKPLIVFRIVKLEAQEEDMAEEFKTTVKSTFTSKDIKTFIGS